jgi:alkanesulfonate monooxygenase SsuD/methylene tetrahydromethanopterin reductase-like flavin-dependent oxidoreductase (luciferase family)
VLIGVGLPTRADGLSPEDLRVWAARADAGPFSSLAALDRVVTSAYEPLITLASVVGITSRIRLLASVVIAPARETTLLARQAASLDALARGRFSLGVGVGIRPDDYAATGFAFDRRGRRLDEQLPLLRGIWRGESIDGLTDRIGPPAARPTGPELLIGGYVPAVARRLAAHGDGFMAPGGGEPERMSELWTSIQAAWATAGRSGRPRWVSSSYVTLGPHADRQAADYIRSSYAFDPALAERRLRAIPTTPQAVRDLIRRHESMGVDELVLRPAAADLRLIDRLADLIGTAAGGTAGDLEA